MTLRGIVSERADTLPEEEIGSLLKIAAERKDIISLGPGEPDFTPPKHVINAACSAIKKGFTHYSPVEGRMELLQAISKKLKSENKIDVPPEQVVVTNGSNEAIMLSLLSIIDPGESCFVPDPGFLAFIPMVEMLNGYPISMPLRYEKDFQADVSDLKKLVEPKKTKAIIVNTPSNPTGTVFPKKVLEEIASFAVENNLLIISDEAYEKFVYDTNHISIGSLNGMANYVLTLQSFSKSYGMPGFRVGYAAGPSKIIKAMRYLHIFVSLSAPTPSQFAAVAALEGPQTSVKKHVDEYNKRRVFLTKRINELEGFECKEPQGAFYIFAKYDYKMKSREFASWLLKNAKVAVVPGADFGKYGEGFLRFSFATKLNLIEKAMDRIERATKKLK